MEVIFSTPTTLGNRTFKAGQQSVPDSLAYNIVFKKMVATGQIRVIARDAAKQKAQMAHDAKAHAKARSARIAAKALQAPKSAMTAPSAPSSPSSAVGPVLALHTPAKPILAEAAVQASAPAASATALSKGGAKK